MGGFFTTYISWRWAFRTELVIAIIVLILARTLQPDHLPDKRPRFDFVGALLSIFGWSSIVLGILLAQKYGFFMAKEPFVLGSWEIAPFGLSITPVLVGFGVLLSARFYANRIIQVGFVIAAAGLGMLAATIQPQASFEDLARASASSPRRS